MIKTKREKEKRKREEGKKRRLEDGETRKKMVQVGRVKEEGKMMKKRGERDKRDREE